MNENDKIQSVTRVKGKFAKGQTGNRNGPKKTRISPVTGALCEAHYEKICEWAKAGLLEPKDVITLFKFEHESLYGKATERIQLSGADGEPLFAGVDRPKDDRDSWLRRHGGN